MNGEDLRFLADRASTVRGRPDDRLAAVHARIRSARRRRAAEAVAATSAAVLALVVGIVVLTGPAGQDKHSGPLPPAHSGTPTPTVPSSTTREIVYGDLGPRGTRVGTIHLGDREVEIDQTLRTLRFWDLHVTDAGVVYDKGDGSVWFTDGGRPRQIAAQACDGSKGSIGPTVATGNGGPWAVWFDCSPGQDWTLVVFDTGSGIEVARQPIPSCRPTTGSACGPDTVVGEHVYFTRQYDPGKDRNLRYRQYRLDVTSGRVTPATPQEYADDLGSHARVLVVGDSWRTGTLEGELDFDVFGSRLVPITYPPDAEHRPARAFDATTGRPVRLLLTRRYHPDPAPGFHGADVSGYFTRFSLFEWLDDDTVALAQMGDNGSVFGDIITCNLSGGRCHVAVKAAAPDQVRILPGGGLPG